MTRMNYASGSRWEPIVGYSRAVRVGVHVYVSGTTSTNAEGQIVGVGDAYAQARQAISNIETALSVVGAHLGDAVRTRIYVVNIEDWEQVGRAHAALFRPNLPASTMVEVRRLVDPQMLVEIEADAIVDDAAEGSGSSTGRGDRPPISTGEARR